LQVLPHYIKANQAILDGEIVVMDERGVSHFELIQPRIHTQDANAIAKMGQKNPVHLFVFDLLYLDGRDLRGEALIERKRLLRKIVKPFTLLRVSESFEGKGEELLEAARQTGLEGLIAKRSTSTYESRRSGNWLKVKLTSEQEFVIGGYTAGEREPFGSLALGYYADEKLHYAGNVGTGFNARNLAELWALLEPLKTSKRPFVGADKIPRGTEWVKPELVAQIKFANWTDDKKLRAPVYLGLRNDKAAAEVEDEQTPKLTNLDKIYYPEDGITKGDLLKYYDAIAPLILPHLKDRPLSLKRYPNGIHEPFFFQKNTPESYPDWLRTETIDGIRYVLAQDKRSLMYLTNLGCIDQNPWMSRIGSLENPDYILIDLDPYECEFRKVVEAALLVKEKLDKIGLKGYPKTTGGDGMHVYIPIKAEYTYEQARSFAEVIARLLAAERPDLFTTPRSVAKREKDRVYFDYLQISESKTIAAPYVARAYPGAPVSTPLAWEEVTPKLLPSQFNIKNAPKRFARTGDLFEGVLKKPQSLVKALGKLNALVKH
jgi:bifunctional non-homologous end joining protein LigD